MTSQEAEVFHKLRVATPLSSRTGHPVSVVFNGVSANSWLSPIGINQQKESRGEKYIAQRPQSTGSIAIIRYHPKPAGLKRNEILTGQHLPVKPERDPSFTRHGHPDHGKFQRPLPFEEDYLSPIGSYMFNQRIAKKGFKGGGFCDGSSKIPRPYTGKAQTRSVREQPINLELTVTSLELNKTKEGYMRREFNEQQLERLHHQNLNVEAYEDLSKTCIRRAKSAPPVTRPSGESKKPSLYWRARSAYHRKLMTPNPDTDLDPSENTQVLRGSMLRPLMYSSSSDIQHSAGCPYKCKGCFKACLVSQDYLEKSRTRRLPLRVRRDFRQRSMMKKDPRYILHQALARNQPIYKLVHGFCDEQTVKEAWDDGGTVRGNDDGSSHPDQFSVVGERGVGSVPDTADDPLSEYDTQSQGTSADDEDSLEQGTDELNPMSSSQLQHKTDLLPNLKPSSNIHRTDTNKRVRSAEHQNRLVKVTLATRPKSCSEAVPRTSDKTNLVIQSTYKEVCDKKSSHHPKGEKEDDDISELLSIASKSVDDECDSLVISDGKRVLKRGLAVDNLSDDLSDKVTTSDTDRDEQEINESRQASSEGEQSGAGYTSFESSDSHCSGSEDVSVDYDRQIVSNTEDTHIGTGSETERRKQSYKDKRRRKMKKTKGNKDISNESNSSSECNSDDSKETLKDKSISDTQTTDSNSVISEDTPSSRGSNDLTSIARSSSRSSRTTEERTSQKGKNSSGKSRNIQGRRKKKLFKEATRSKDDNEDSESDSVSNRNESESTIGGASSVINSATESELQFDSENTKEFDESSLVDTEESDSESESEDHSEHIEKRPKGQTNKKAKPKPLNGKMDKKQSWDKSMDPCKENITGKPSDHSDSNSMNAQVGTCAVEESPKDMECSNDGDINSRKTDKRNNKMGHKRGNKSANVKKLPNKRNVNKVNKKKRLKKRKKVDKQESGCETHGDEDDDVDDDDDDDDNGDDDDDDNDDDNGDDDDDEEEEEEQEEEDGDQEGLKKGKSSSNASEEESDSEDIDSEDNQKKKKVNTNKKTKKKITLQKQHHSKKCPKKNEVKVGLKSTKMHRKRKSKSDKVLLEDRNKSLASDSEDYLSGDRRKSSQSDRTSPLSDEHQSQNDVGQSDDTEPDSDKGQSDDREGGSDGKDSDTEIQSRGKDKDSECDQLSDTEGSGQRSEDDVQDSPSEEEEESEDEEDESDEDTDTDDD